MDPSDLEEGEVFVETEDLEQEVYTTKGFLSLKNQKESKKKPKKAKKQKIEEAVPQSEEEEPQPGDIVQKKVKSDKKPKKKANEFVSSNFKTKACEFYKKGGCHKGENCPYRHDFEVEKRDDICKFYLADNCSKGESCVFSHDLKKYPCKFYWGANSCQSGNNCRFSHDLPQEKAKIFDFIKDNEEIFKDIYKKHGRTHIGQWFIDYMQEKEKEEKKDNFYYPGMEVPNMYKMPQQGQGPSSYPPPPNFNTNQMMPPNQMHPNSQMPIYQPHQISPNTISNRPMEPPNMYSSGPYIPPPNTQYAPNQPQRMMPQQINPQNKRQSFDPPMQMRGMPMHNVQQPFIQQMQPPIKQGGPYGQQFVLVPLQNQPPMDQQMRPYQQNIQPIQQMNIVYSDFSSQNNYNPNFNKTIPTQPLQSQQIQQPQQIIPQQQHQQMQQIQQQQQQQQIQQQQQQQQQMQKHQMQQHQQIQQQIQQQQQQPQQYVEPPVSKDPRLKSQNMGPKVIQQVNQIPQQIQIQPQNQIALHQNIIPIQNPNQILLQPPALVHIQPSNQIPIPQMNPLPPNQMMQIPQNPYQNPNLHHDNKKMFTPSFHDSALNDSFNSKGSIKDNISEASSSNKNESPVTDKKHEKLVIIKAQNQPNTEKRIITTGKTMLIIEKRKKNEKNEFQQKKDHKPAKDLSITLPTSAEKRKKIKRATFKPTRKDSDLAFEAEKEKLQDLADLEQRKKCFEKIGINPNLPEKSEEESKKIIKDCIKSFGFDQDSTDDSEIINPEESSTLLWNSLKELKNFLNKKSTV